MPHSSWHELCLPPISPSAQRPKVCAGCRSCPARTPALRSAYRFSEGDDGRERTVVRGGEGRGDVLPRRSLALGIRKYKPTCASHRNGFARRGVKRPARDARRKQRAQVNAAWVCGVCRKTWPQRPCGWPLRPPVSSPGRRVHSQHGAVLLRLEPRWAFRQEINASVPVAPSVLAICPASLLGPPDSDPLDPRAVNRPRNRARRWSETRIRPRS